MFGQAQGQAKAGDPAADNEDIMCILGAHLLDFSPKYANRVENSGFPDPLAMRI
jgi:hypothetical protein